ncbi:hydrogenase expression/formation protein [Halovivax asiaticus JCM 14624]|uniref:Hydrogenase expression/formation protein n=1 Tax=Halovivax asiaticus JCM 14624 TaxID=1227490 RepID=M0BFX7_9EURY|nr:AIR synthase-related protein [Halovivax asiaticus]ELZ08524.1 hydrogenase expression/formation protein [Halovivax asiaticus JCM 14624]
MTDAGRIDREFFEATIASSLGADRQSTSIGPAYGMDFGLIDGDRGQLVVASDPLSVLPALGFERAGRLGIHGALSDVAVSGLAPSHLVVTLTLPPSMTETEFVRFWTGISDECERLNVDIVSGHTHRDGGSYPLIGGATALGLGSAADVVRPDGAQPGDRILLTKGLAREVTGLFATLFPDALDVSSDGLRRAQSHLDRTTLVRDALAASEAAAVSAMHDATECGVQGALVEMATTADVGMTISTDRFVVDAAVEAVCDVVDLDPWQVSSRGTLLLSVPSASVDSVRSALTSRNTPVTDIGVVTGDSVVTIDGTPVSHPGTDPAWGVLQELSDAN